MAATNIGHSEYGGRILGSKLTEDAIFRRALLIPAKKQRLKFLDDECGKDKALRDHLAKLLEADAKEWKQFDSVLQQQPTSKEVAEPIPSLKNYQVHERIGSGGMADVFAAEQLTPFRRQVAVKVQRTNQFDSEACRRFESEQQTLATLKHENIATIYDAGLTINGAPYVSMELVRGEPITTYCNDHRLTIEDRLRLLLDVCNGVEYAHHNGVIHRDLKPANILIAEKVHGPQPKIIDFGIAKNTEASPHDKKTKAGKILGTLDYMSPEQLGNAPSTVDAHSDIYSLGVILHEMLVDEIPLKKELSQSTTLEERLKCTRTTVAAPISSTLMSLENSTLLSENRSSSFEELKRQFTPALDRIVSRMIAKRPDQRYATVQQVATDLEQLLKSNALDSKSKVGTPRTMTRRRFRFAIIFFLIFLCLIGLLHAFRIGTLQRVSKRGRSESNQRGTLRPSDSDIALDAEAPPSADQEAGRIELSQEIRPAQQNSELLPDKSHEIDEFYYRILDRRPVAAFQLAKSWPADPQLEQLREQLTDDVTLTDVPPDAVVEICDWIKEPFEWHRVETTNGKVTLPLGRIFIEPLKKFYTRSFRIRITCPGYLTRELLLSKRDLAVIDGEIGLVKRTEPMPDDMTLVPAFTSPDNTRLKYHSSLLRNENAFWMDRHEVSNEDYLEFVKAGAYERPEFWTSVSFLFNGEELPFESAMKRFVDRTGNPGPASWSDGCFAPGMEKYPVSGVSFLEAASYASYRGKSLPTPEQWHHAASALTSAGMVARNNFASDGPERCGANSGIGRFNIQDLGGNVREWCGTSDIQGNSYILGGSWKSPPFALHSNITANQWDRSEVNGIRCCRSIREGKRKESGKASVVTYTFPTEENPKYSRPSLTELGHLHDYDRDIPTDPTGNQIQNATFASAGMSHTIAQIASAHQSSRYNLHLLGPTQHQRPLRCLIVLPNSREASQTSQSLPLQALANPESLAMTADILSRYSLLLCVPDLNHPIHLNESKKLANNSEGLLRKNGTRDTSFNNVKDTMRALDYLLSRDDLDAEHCYILAFGNFGPSALRLLALDKRLQAGALVATGYGSASRPGRGMRTNLDKRYAAYQYVPHVKQPVLMINGSRDLEYPETIAQIPLYQELGSVLKKKITIGTNLLHQPQHFGKVLQDAADWFHRQTTSR